LLFVLRPGEALQTTQRAITFSDNQINIAVDIAIRQSCLPAQEARSPEPPKTETKKTTKDDELERILASNRYSARETDLDTLYDPGVAHGIDQFQIEASDAALDAYLGSITSLAGCAVYALRISQTRYFDYFDPFADDVPARKLPLPESTIRVLLPCCIVIGHWSLLTYDVKAHCFELFDPLYSVTADMIKRVKKIAAAFQSFYDVEVREPQYRFCCTCKHQQRGTLNCGIRVAYFAKQIVMQEPFDAKVCMLEFRQEMKFAVVEHLRDCATSI
jgi:hypothetical protein